ncbi:PEP-CTERM sorting domain-containing protein [Luteolibacter yonseiensis]|uniref:PEP-CTERM sorting domain-containing protein n=1 Tax=Luteolibacter yonseiensis TaxID=1144680 RepID=A0A934VAM8_9BACT|nr:all3515 family Zur-repressed PEP-CTERM protein [Luteolibacter yonseiensis]MBK1815031.1 PEP-CTERM sorting domain-containing protein [Luteolibacter yonseiensis]
MKIKHFTSSRNPISILNVATALMLAVAPEGDAAFVSYYVGVDGLATIASGTYAGLSNPNLNRLTLLYAHVYPDTPASNHYHSKGVYRYTGPNLGEGQTSTEINPANYLPEGTAPPLLMTVGTGGLYDGKFVSAPEPGNPFSLSTIQDTGKLSGFSPGSGESILFNSGANRWNGSLIGADVHLELVSLSAGLNVGNSTVLNLFSSPGDNHHLDDSFSFTPVFWTDADASPGTYTAQFKLTDESGIFGDSGTFEYRFDVVPEPSSASLGAFGVLALFRRRR